MTARGLRIALFFTRAHARLFRPGLAAIMPDAVRDDSRLRRALINGQNHGRPVRAEAFVDRRAISTQVRPAGSQDLVLRVISKSVTEAFAEIVLASGHKHDPSATAPPSSPVTAA